MPLNVPPNYRPLLDLPTTLQAVARVDDTFRRIFAETLDLTKVPAQLFVAPECALNDDLETNLRPVTFSIDSMEGRKAEIVRSLSKWKRVKLKEYGFPEGRGLLAETKAIRVDDVPDNIHSVFVDQWDWERRIRREDRTLDFLQEIVRKIYRTLRELENFVCGAYPPITPYLPEEIVFFHAEELLRQYPTLDPAQREFEVVQKFGAVFVIGIGDVLSDGRKHGERNPDCDDWSTPCGNGFHGLNGDLFLWNPVLRSPMEISSMGIRVDETALQRQLFLCDCEHFLEWPFHRAVSEERLPLSIGGGIGQSRLCMFMLRKAHIGEIQASLWPDETLRDCSRNGIPLL